MVTDEALDLRATLVSLLPAEPGRDGYTHLERYRDLNATFSGRATPEQAQRALYVILAETGIHKIDYSVDVQETYRRLGKREVGLTLIRYLTEEIQTDLPTNVQNAPDRST